MSIETSPNPFTADLVKHFLNDSFSFSPMTHFSFCDDGGDCNYYKTQITTLFSDPSTSNTGTIVGTDGCVSKMFSNSSSRTLARNENMPSENVSEVVRFPFQVSSASRSTVGMQIASNTDNENRNKDRFDNQLVYHNFARDKARDENAKSGCIPIAPNTVPNVSTALTPTHQSQNSSMLSTGKASRKHGSSVRPFLCSKPGCGKRFTKKWNMQAHERIHTGLTPFVCRLGCGAAYMWMSSRTSHEQKRCPFSRQNSMHIEDRRRRRQQQPRSENEDNSHISHTSLVAAAGYSAVTDIPTENQNEVHMMSDSFTQEQFSVQASGILDTFAMQNLNPLKDYSNNYRTVSSREDSDFLSDNISFIGCGRDDWKGYAINDDVLRDVDISGEPLLSNDSFLQQIVLEHLDTTPL